MHLDSVSDLVVIGSSTGGPRTLNSILNKVRLRCTVVIVQHMPAYINQALCETIARESGMPTKIPENSERLKPATIYVAPSEVHLELGTEHQAQLRKSEAVNFVCPSIDVTMHSLAARQNPAYMGIILTGMGKDGAMGIAHMKSIGATTVAQQPETCTIDSMPRSAINTGSVDLILAPEAIRTLLISRWGL